MLGSFVRSDSRNGSFGVVIRSRGPEPNEGCFIRWYWSNGAQRQGKIALAYFEYSSFNDRLGVLHCLPCGE